MRRQVLFTLFCIGLFSWSAVSLRIVCTTTILGDVVGRIAGEENEQTVLLPFNADPHAFEPTPADLVAIARADVVFLNGAGLEAHLEPILKTSADFIVRLSDDLDLLYLDDVHHEHDHAEPDPHVWFDPTYVMRWTDRIADTLADRDPDHASAYQARAAVYRGELADLDRWIEEQVSRLPHEDRQLVTDHAVLGYFAARYGFEQIGTVFPGLSSLSEPSARGLAALEDAIAAIDLPAIFVGTTVNPSLAEQIAADTDTQIVPLYTGSLSEPGGPADSYLKMMHYDVTAIVEGLLGASP